MPFRETLSTLDISRACQVSLTTVASWIDAGKLVAHRTPGGHRRVRRDDLVKFLEKYRMPIPPDLARKNRRVLIVDDDEAVLESLSELLKSEGFDVETSNSGFDAGAKIAGRRPDVILLDIKMPGMDGFQVCRQLRSQEATRRVPVIAITVLGERSEVNRMLEAGVTDYLRKPLDPKRLIRKINRHCPAPFV